MSTTPIKPRSLFVTDIDGTLVLESSSEQPGLSELADLLLNRGNGFLFAVATGRSLPLVQRIFKEHHVPDPDFVIASVGTRIYEGLTGSHDATWSRHLTFDWNPDVLRGLEALVPGLRLQEAHRQNEFKVSYYVDAKKFDPDALRAALTLVDSRANAIITQGKFLDLLPPRASKGRALRYLAAKLGIDMSYAVAAGDAGNDRDMLETAGRAIVVANHSPELADLSGRPSVVFSPDRGPAGILDGMRRHGLLPVARSSAYKSFTNQDPPQPTAPHSERASAEFPLPRFEGAQ